MPKKKSKKLPGTAYDEPLPEWAALDPESLSKTRTIIITYNPILDSVEIDSGPASALEVRGILTVAADIACGTRTE